MKYFDGIKMHGTTVKIVYTSIIKNQSFEVVGKVNVSVCSEIRTKHINAT